MPDKQAAFYERHLVLRIAGEQLMLFPLSFMASSVVFVSPSWWVNISGESLQFCPKQSIPLPPVQYNWGLTVISMATCEVQGWLGVSAKKKEGIIFQTEDMHVAFYKISPWALALK